MTRVVELVISHYAESLEWVRNLPPTLRVTIYHKGNQSLGCQCASLFPPPEETLKFSVSSPPCEKCLPDRSPAAETELCEEDSVPSPKRRRKQKPLPSVQCRWLPNIGREADVYLQHIVHEYERFTSRSAQKIDHFHQIIFCQANPFPHCSLFSSYVKALCALPPPSNTPSYDTATSAASAAVSNADFSQDFEWLGHCIESDDPWGLTYLSWSKNSTGLGLPLHAFLNFLNSRQNFQESQNQSHRVNASCLSALYHADVSADHAEGAEHCPIADGSLSTKIPTGWKAFMCGGQFMVSVSTILVQPLQYYVSLLELLHNNAKVLELLRSQLQLQEQLAVAPPASHPDCRGLEGLVGYYKLALPLDRQAALGNMLQRMSKALEEQEDILHVVPHLFERAWDAVFRCRLICPSTVPCTVWLKMRAVDPAAEGFFAEKAPSAGAPSPGTAAGSDPSGSEGSVSHSLAAVRQAASKHPCCVQRTVTIYVRH